MYSKLVIGLLGKAGSGKSTAARFFQEQGAEVLSFAKPLKLMAKDLFGFSDDQVWGSAEHKEVVDPRWGLTPRHVMQTIGQSAREHLGPSVWIDGVKSYIERSENRFFVIEDVRYKNEAAFIAECPSFDGRVIKLFCPVSISKDRGEHPSEAQVDQVPLEHLYATIRNDYDRGFLRELSGILEFPNRGF